MRTMRHPRSLSVSRSFTLIVGALLLILSILCLGALPASATAVTVANQAGQNATFTLTRLSDGAPALSCYSWDGLALSPTELWRGSVANFDAERAELVKPNETVVAGN